MSDPVGGYCVVSNLWIREMKFEKAGDTMHGHKHTFDHATLCAAGKFRVHIGDDIHEVQAPCVLYIEKDKEHSIEAIEDGSIAYCLHGIHDPDDWDHIINPDMMPQFGGKVHVPLLKDEADMVRSES